jgi:hypothetical protein
MSGIELDQIARQPTRSGRATVWPIALIQQQLAAPPADDPDGQD